MIKENSIDILLSTYNNLVNTFWNEVKNYLSQKLQSFKLLIEDDGCNWSSLDIWRFLFVKKVEQIYYASNDCFNIFIMSKTKKCLKY